MGSPKVLAKDDLCPKCLIILEDASKMVFHYARDMIEIESIIKSENEIPLSVRAKMVEDILDQRQERILREMRDGRIKRS
jgi:hypothetical protein